MNNTGNNKTNLLLSIIVLLIVVLVAVVIYAVNDIRQQRDLAQEKARVMQEKLNRSQASDGVIAQSASVENLGDNKAESQKSEPKSQNATQEDTHERSIAISRSSVPLGELPDGTYCYKGTWNSANYNPSACHVEFTKSGNSLSKCSYTNNRFNVIVPLSGSVDGTTVTLQGSARFEPLEITLDLGNGIQNLTGYGYQGSLDHATLTLSKVSGSSSAGKISRVVGDYEGDGAVLCLYQDGDAYWDGDYYTYSISGDKVKLRDSNNTYAFIFNSSSRTLKKGSTTYYRK